MDLLDRMLGHDRWTTSRLLEMSRELGDEQLDQRFDIGHETLRATLEHMIFNVEAWTALMAGELFDADRNDKSLPTLIERHERSYDHFTEVARWLYDENRLSETFIDDYDVDQEMGSTILHVILHNHMHRSEVLHILKRLGVPDLPEGDPQEWEHLAQRSMSS